MEGNSKTISRNIPRYGKSAIKKSIKDIPLQMVGIVVFKLILDFAYVTLVSGFFSYGGFYDYWTFERSVVSWITTFALSYYWGKVNIQTRLSSTVTTIWIFVYIIPSLVLFEYGVFDEKYYIGFLTYWLLYFMFRELFCHVKGTKIRFSLLDENRRVIIKIIEIVSVLTILIIAVRYSGFNFSIGLYDVYAQRTASVRYGIPTVLSYLLGGACAVMPLMIIRALMNREILKAGFYIFIQLVNFGINGLKSTFFILIISLLVFFFFREKDYKKIVLAFILFLAACLIEFYSVGTIYLTDFLLRRVLFVPGQLSSFYYDFFTTHTPDYFSASFMRFLGVKSVYGHIPRMIGYEYLHKDVSANCGLLADATLNLGIVGIIVFPIILAIFMRILDKCEDRNMLKVYLVPCVYIAYVLITASFTTALLTHGLFILIVYMICMNSKKEVDGNE